jgi:hypothetical protein
VNGGGINNINTYHPSMYPNNLFNVMDYMNNFNKMNTINNVNPNILNNYGNSPHNIGNINVNMSNMSHLEQQANNLNIMQNVNNLNTGNISAGQMNGINHNQYGDQKYLETLMYLRNQQLQNQQHQQNQQNQEQQQQQQQQQQQANINALYNKACSINATHQNSLLNNIIRSKNDFLQKRQREDAYAGCIPFSGYNLGHNLNNNINNENNNFKDLINKLNYNNISMASSSALQQCIVNDTVPLQPNQHSSVFQVEKVETREFEEEEGIIKPPVTPKESSFASLLEFAKKQD